MSMHLEIVTVEQTLFEGDVDAVIAPGELGQLGILPKHAPLMTTLMPGRLRCRTGSGETSFVVHGGFIEITGERVVVLADAAENLDVLDVERAEESKRRAEERIALGNNESIDTERALRSLGRARTRLLAAIERR